MTRALRNLLACGALSALAASLSACGPDEAQERPTAMMGLADTALQPEWSMDDLAGVDPEFLGGGEASLPQALPMQDVWDGGYAAAPSFDYAPEFAEADYAPLDESYYQPAHGGGTDDYALLALASALAGMLGDSPPDYAFGYDEVEPWGWETGDRYRRYAEPIDGGYRHYYYEPDAERPFLVRDPYYSYGYRGDRLVAIYDRHGRLIDSRRAERQRLAARSYYARAERLHRAAQRDRRYGVPAPLWERRRDEIARERAEWRRARAEREGWQRWDEDNARKLRREWTHEALVRRDAERRFQDWRRAGYRTAAPEFYTRRAHDEQLRRLTALRRQEAARVEEQRRARRLEARREDERRSARAGRREIEDRRERRQAEAERRERVAATAAAERRREASDTRARQIERQRQAERRDEQRKRQAHGRKEEQQRQAAAKREQAQAAAAQAKREEARAAQAHAKREEARLAAAQAKREQAQAAAAKAKREEARAAEAHAKREEARLAAAQAKREQAQAAAAQAKRQQAQEAAAEARKAQQQQARQEARRQAAAEGKRNARRAAAAEKGRAERPRPAQPV